MILIGGRTELTPCQVGRRHHRRRDPHQSELTGNFAGLFMRDAKPEQLLEFTGTLLILNGFIGSGSAQEAPPLHRKVG